MLRSVIPSLPEVSGKLSADSLFRSLPFSSLTKKSTQKSHFSKASQSFSFRLHFNKPAHTRSRSSKLPHCSFSSSIQAQHKREHQLTSSRASLAPQHITPNIQHRPFSSAAQSPAQNTQNSSSLAPDNGVTDKYTSKLLVFAEKMQRPLVRLSGIKYDGTSRRFYEKTGYEEVPDGFAPSVGGRLMQSANGYLIVVPSRLLAQAIALEWDCQKEFIKPHTMPLMHLAIQTLDQVATRRPAMCSNLLEHIHNDAVCIRDFENGTFVRVQEKHLDPIVEWVEERFGVKVKVGDRDTPSVHVVKQRPELRKAFESSLSKLPDWEIAVFESLCGVSKSLMISFAVLEGQLDLNRAFESARLEENYSMRKYGMISGCFGHGIDIEYTKVKLAAARSLLNFLNLDTEAQHTALRQRNSHLGATKPDKPPLIPTADKFFHG